jgi:DAK2 domain fusion protein YloV
VGGRPLDAQTIRQAIEATLADLRAVRASIDAANVYPVADSDTGTNLVMTFDTVAAAVASVDDAGVSHALRSGSLKGARGNSGVIVAQILRGFADGVEAGPADVEGTARAFKRAAELAYEAVLDPAEGTILSVAAAAADAAQGSHETVSDQFAAAARAAQDALARTPEQMPILKEAGVVDAGGMGLVVMLDAFARALGADVGRPAPAEGETHTTPAPIRDAASSRYAYEVQYLLRAPDETMQPLRNLLGSIGDSVAVIGGDGLWRIHVHTDERERAIAMGDAFGDVSDVDVVSFAEQIEQTNEAARASAQPVELPSPQTPGVRGIPVAEAHRPATLVAVVSGSGVEKLFADLGAITVRGAAGRAVTDEELLNAIESAGQKEVIVLPNHEEVFGRLIDLRFKSSKTVSILRTGDMAAGLAAALAYGDARDTEAALRDMQAALDHVRTGMVATAQMSGDSPAGPIEPGQSVGIAEGAIVVVADDPVGVVCEVGKALLEGDRELLTILYAEEVSEPERDRLQQAMKTVLPSATVELHAGGQPLHRYILSAE